MNSSKKSEKCSEVKAIDGLAHVLRVSEHLLEHAESMDYQFILEEMTSFCGARFGVMNLFDEDEMTFRTVALSGGSEFLIKGAGVLGFNPLYKQWNPNEKRKNLLQQSIITHFPSLSDMAEGVIPRSVSLLISKTFRIGEVLLLKISSTKQLLGDFTMLMPDDVQFSQDDIVTLCLHQIGNAIFRFQSEENLIYSRKFARAILETSKDGFWIIDTTDARILDVNETYCLLSGYHRSELLTMKISDLEVLELPADTIAHIEKIRKIGSDSFQTQHRCKDGALIDLEITSTWMEGKKPSLICFCRDITSRIKSDIRQREIQAELEESEYRFKMLHNASFGGISIHDHGIILDCNMGLSEMMGYSKNDLIGMDGMLLVAPHDREKVMEKIQTGFERSYEADGIRKNGEIFPMRLEARNIQYKGNKVRIVEFRDISEQRKAVEALRESENKYRLLFYQMNTINSLYEVLIDEEGKPYDYRYLEVNRAFEDLIGMKASQVVGKTLLELFPQTEPWWLEKFEEAFITEELITFENYSKALDAYAELNIYTPQKGQIVMMSHDITERKNAERALHVKNHDLEALNEELNAALEELAMTNEELFSATRKAEEASRAKSQFLANMSHEIRTPMNGFMGMIQLLARTPLSEEQKELLDIAKSSFNTLLTVINDILDYSKIEEGMAVMAEVPFHLRKTIEDATNLFTPSAIEKYLCLDLSVDSSLPDLWLGDPFRLRQVLSNLIGNAVKYTGKGSIHVKVVGTCPDEEGNMKLTCTVTDTGIGIDAANLDKLFTRFTQIDDSLTRSYGGTGLGLAICKGLVENMGGHIWVESSPGIGSSFHFDCLLHSLSAEYVDVENSSISQESQEKNKSRNEEIVLLVVDDDEINRIVIAKFAEIHSWKVVTAENGLDAVSICEKMRFHAILMDVQMPVMDGFKATETIRAMEITSGQHTPIIAITAYAMDEDRKKCLSAGMDDYLTKPLLNEAFYEVIERWACQSFIK